MTWTNNTKNTATWTNAPEDTDFLLMEDSSNLLLESEGRIILEQAQEGDDWTNNTKN